MQEVEDMPEATIAADDLENGANEFVAIMMDGIDARNLPSDDSIPNLAAAFKDTYYDYMMRRLDVVEPRSRDFSPT